MHESGYLPLLDAPQDTLYDRCLSGVTRLMPETVGFFKDSCQRVVFYGAEQALPEPTTGDLFIQCCQSGAKTLWLEAGKTVCKTLTQPSFEDLKKLESYSSAVKGSMPVECKDKTSIEALVECCEYGVLGKGAFGKVYRGVWKTRPVALKEIDIKKAQKELHIKEAQAKDAVAWEIGLLSTSVHPNIVEFYGIYEAQSRVFLVMTLCEGGSLGVALAQQSATDVLKWGLRWQWALGIAAGLEYLHHQGILHRDLKAENVLLDGNGCTRLVDLGVSQADAILQPREPTVVERGFQDQRFRAPDAIHKKSSDIYALGLVFWQIVTGGQSPRYYRVTDFLGVLNSLSHAKPLNDIFKDCARKESFKAQFPKIAKAEALLYALIQACWDTPNRPSIQKIIKTLNTILEMEGHRPIPLEEMAPLKVLLASHYNDIQKLPSALEVQQVLSQIARSIDWKQIPSDCPPLFKQLILDCWKLALKERPTIEKVLEILRAPALKSLHSRSDWVLACQQVESQVHLSRIEGLKYVDPFVTTYAILEDLDTYWVRLEQLNTPQPSGEPPLLSESIEVFLAQPNPGTLLLLGDSGVGKSFSTLQLADRLLTDYWAVLRAKKIAEPYYPVLLRSLLDDWSEAALENGMLKALQKLGLESFNQERFLVIVDAYDECRDTTERNIADLLGLQAYPKAKLLVSCRPQTVERSAWHARFALNDTLTTRHFLPFRMTQMLDYLEDGLNWHQSERQSYKVRFDKLPALRAVLRNPFVLSLLVQSWETVVVKQKSFERLDRYQIYQGFVTHWLETQKRLLSPEVQQQLQHLHTDLVDSFNHFASEIAFKAFAAGRLELTLNAAALSEAVRPWEQLKSLVQDNSLVFFEQHRAGLREQDRHRALLDAQDFKLIMERQLVQFESSSPLKNRSGVYELSHRSFFEYFVARCVIDLRTKTPEQILQEGLQLLNVRCLQEEPEVLRFIAEAWKESETEILEKPFLKIVKASKNNSAACQSASNAITVLNRAGIPFSREVFPEVHITGADLSGAICDGTNFEGANLSSVNFNSAWLSRASFRNADLEGVEFGEWPNRKHTFSVHAICYSPLGYEVHLINQADLGTTLSVEVVPALVLGANQSIQLITQNEDQTFCCLEISEGSTKDLEETLRLILSMSHITGKAFFPASSNLGKWLVSQGHRTAPRSLYVAVGNGKLITVYHAKTLQKCWDHVGHNDHVTALSYSPDGKHLASGSDDKTIRIWDAHGERLNELSARQAHAAEIRALAYSPDGKHLASGSLDKRIKIWDSHKECLDELYTWQAHTAEIRALAYSPDGKHLASGSDDKTVRIWNLQKGCLNPELLRTCEGHTSLVHALAYSPNGACLASGSWDKKIKVWAMQAEGHSDALRTYQGHTSYICALTYSPDGQYLASGSDDKTVKIWDAQGKRLDPLHTYEGHSSYIRALAYSPDGKQLACGAYDTMFKILNMQEKWFAASRISSGHSGVCALAYSRDGKHLVSGSKHEPNSGRYQKSHDTLKMWGVGIGRLTELQTHEGRATAVTYSPNGEYLASGSGHTLRIWNVHQESLRLLCVQEEHDEIHALAYSPNGRFLALGSGDFTLRAWDVLEGRLEAVRVYNRHTKPITALAYSIDSRFLISGSANCGPCRCALNIWVTGSESLEPVYSYIPPSSDEIGAGYEFISAVACSPDSRFLVAGFRRSGSGYALTVWDWDVSRAVIPESVRSYRISDNNDEGHGFVEALAYSPDSQFLVLGCCDNTLKILEASSFKLINSVNTGANISSLAFSPIQTVKGAQIFSTAHVDGNIMCWNLSHKGCVSLTAQATARNLYAENLNLKGARNCLGLDVELLKQRGATGESTHKKSQVLIFSKIPTHQLKSAVGLNVVTTSDEETPGSERRCAIF